MKCEKTYSQKNRHMKLLVLTLTVLLMFGGMVGSTVAWLIDDTDPVTNTFIDSDIEVELTETKEDFKMIPGWTIEKDPVVTIKADSEDCWVFLIVTESDNLDDYITYAIDGNNWELLQKDGEKKEAVYYCKVEAVEKDRKIKVLGYYDADNNFVNNQVLVKEDVTKDMMDLIDGVVAPNQDGSVDSSAVNAEINARPTLTFEAYAVQLYKNNTTEFTPDEAWAQVLASLE